MFLNAIWCFQQATKQNSGLLQEHQVVFPMVPQNSLFVWEYSQEWAYASVIYSSELKLEINFNNLKPLS